MADDATEVRVNIYDTEHIVGDTDPVAIFDLKPSGNPLVVQTVNSGNEKYGIFSKQANLEFLSTNLINAFTFIEATDQRWYVEILVDGTETLFLGYLVLSEVSRPFMPNPTVIQLTASDNLGLLKERPLTTPAGAVPTGKAKLSEYIAWCLKRTGLNLPIKVVNNIKPGKGTLATPLFFSATGDYFVTTGLVTDFFDGMKTVVIANMPTNNGTFTIESVDSSGLVTQVNLVEAISVSDSSVTATATDGATGHFYDKVYADAKTWETEIGELEDSYAVFESILDKDCYITQYKGEWWIVRPNEINTDLYYVASYDEDGEYQSIAAGADYTKEIGISGDAYWVDAAQTVTYDRPFKFSKHTFRYEYPKETPCNKDFQRGDLIDVLPDETINGQIYSLKKYELDCWTLVKDLDAPNHQTAATQNEVYIRRFFDSFGVEKFKDVAITWPSSEPSRLEHEPIEVTFKDKHSFSYGFKWSSSFGGSGSTNFIQCHVRLEGKDGSYWFWDDNDGIWHDGGSTWSNLRTISLNWVPNDVDETEWQNVSFEVSEYPVDGNIIIAIYWGNISAVASRTLYVADFRFEYIPLINGSFQNFIGQTSKAERDETGYSANFDEEVKLSDSPKPLLKGGLFTKHGTEYFLQPVYWDSQQWALGTPNQADQYHPYEYIRVNGTYNQNHKAIRYFDGNVKTLDVNWCDVIHNYKLIDIDTDTNNRRFMLLEMEQNWKTGIWRAKFSETYHTDGRVFPPFEFKYITE